MDRADVSPAPGEKPGARRGGPIAVGATQPETGRPAAARPPEAAKACRVVLVDEQPVFAEGLRAACEGAGLTVLDTAAAAKEVLPLVQRWRPDVVAVSLLLPSLKDGEITREIARVSPQTRVLFLTTTLDLSTVVAAWRAGAAGVALKSGLSEELIAAIRNVAAGGTYVGPSDPTTLQTTDAPPRCGPLTRREVEVLRLIAEGKTVRQVAAQAAIAPKTAEHHRDHIKRKLGVQTTAELVRSAIRLGLLAP